MSEQMVEWGALQVRTLPAFFFNNWRVGGDESNCKNSLGAKKKTADEWSEIKIRSATEEKEELVVDRESRTEK